MILQRLNMDTSWLIELSGTTIVVDPWLEGVEIDFFGGSPSGTARHHCSHADIGCP